MDSEPVTVRPGDVAAWGTQAEAASGGLIEVPRRLRRARAAVDEGGGTALAGGSALHALAEAAAATSDQTRSRVAGTGQKLRSTAAVYAGADADSAAEVTAAAGDARELP